jgi:hypothetical protein
VTATPITEQRVGEVLREWFGMKPTEKLTVARDARALVIFLVRGALEHPELDEAIWRLLGDEQQQFELVSHNGGRRLVLRSPIYVGGDGELHCRTCGGM